MFAVTRLAIRKNIVPSLSKNYGTIAVTQNSLRNCSVIESVRSFRCRTGIARLNRGLPVNKTIVTLRLAGWLNNWTKLVAFKPEACEIENRLNVISVLNVLNRIWLAD